jgi:hypothetical protein
MTELARHISESGKNVTNLQRMWQMRSSKSKVGISGGVIGKNGKQLNSPAGTTG